MTNLVAVLLKTKKLQCPKVSGHREWTTRNCWLN